MSEFLRCFLLPVGFFVLSVIIVMKLVVSFLSKINSNKKRKQIQNEWDKNISQANQRFDGNILANTILQKILATPYVDICVYSDKVVYNNTTLKFSDYNYTNVHNFYLLAIWIKERLPNKELYVIEKIVYPSEPRDILEGYKIHNKNFDGKYLKVWNNNTGTYENWDPKSQKWFTEW